MSISDDLFKKVQRRIRVICEEDADTVANYTLEKAKEYAPVGKTIGGTPVGSARYSGSGKNRKITPLSKHGTLKKAIFKEKLSDTEIMVYVDSSMTTGNNPNKFPYEVAITHGRKGFSAKPGNVLMYVDRNKNTGGASLKFRHSVGPAEKNDFMQKAVDDAEKHFANGIRTVSVEKG